MNKKDAIIELKAIINDRHAHAVLLCTDDNHWYTELHAGHAGNCCCNEHAEFIWRETSPYTNPEEINNL